ncbi:unnamed protein product [Ilex paraguariensis]|uniref:RNase H type-1 domain-containing protein n=1 Tax=Ilex paraguariensis TaxID=185542 RepID=A0ABC8UV93_9AQUA
MNLLRQIKDLLGMVEFESRHVYREANMVADSLANQAVSVTHFSAKYFKGQHLLRNIGNVHPKCFRILIPWFEVVVANTKLLVGNGCTADFLLEEVQVYGISLASQNDRLIWQLNSMGKFSVRTTWELVRIKGMANLAGEINDADS